MDKINQQAPIPSYSQLEYAFTHGILNIQDIEQQIHMTKREEIQRKHKYQIKQNADGSWSTHVYDKHRKNHQRTIHKSTKEKLLDELIRFYAEYEANPTIEDCYSQWMDELDVRLSTKDRYRRQYKQFFEGSLFSKLKIKDISRKDVELFVLNLKRDRNLNRNAYKKLWEILGAILDVALYDYDVDLGKEYVRGKLSKKFKASGFAPSHDMMIPEEEKFFDPETEISNVINYCTDTGSLVDLGIAFDLKMGYRPGEGSALRKSDVSKDFHFIYIHAIEQRYKENESDDHYTVKVYDLGSKTEAGTRKVPVPDSMIPILKKIFLMSNPGSEWLFSDDKYDRYPSAKFQRRLRTICKALNMPNKSYTDIRHTYASLLDDTSLSNRAKATIMGHSTYDVTQKHYTKDVHDIEYKRELLNNVL